MSALRSNRALLVLASFKRVIGERTLALRLRTSATRSASSLLASLRSGHLWKKKKIGKQTHTEHRARSTNRKQQGASQLSPEKKVEYGRVPRRTFSPCPPGSNCLFSSLGVLCLWFSWITAVEKMSAKVRVLVDRSGGDGVLPLDLNPRPRSRSRWRWFVVVPIPPRSGDPAIRVSRGPYQLMMI